MLAGFALHMYVCMLACLFTWTNHLLQSSNEYIPILNICSHILVRSLLPDCRSLLPDCSISVKETRSEIEALLVSVNLPEPYHNRPLFCHKMAEINKHRGWGRLIQVTVHAWTILKHGRYLAHELTVKFSHVCVENKPCCWCYMHSRVPRQNVKPAACFAQANPTMTSVLLAQANPTMTSVLLAQANPTMTSVLLAQANPTMTSVLLTQANPTMTSVLLAQANPTMTSVLLTQANPTMTSVLLTQANPTMTSVLLAQANPTMTSISLVCNTNINRLSAGCFHFLFTLPTSYPYTHACQDSAVADQDCEYGMDQCTVYSH